MMRNVFGIHEAAFTRPFTFFGTYFLVFSASYILLARLDLLPEYAANSSIFVNPFLLVLVGPWLIFALLSTFGDASVGYVDEYLLKEIKKTGDVDTDAPGRLVLLSGFFGIIVMTAVTLYSIITGVAQSLFVSEKSFLLGTLAGFLEVLWMIPYFYALQRGGALNTTPLFQTVPIFSLIFGLILFNEIPELHHIFAAALIVIGATLLNFSIQTKRVDINAVTLMLTSSAVISLGYFVFKASAESGSFLSSVFANAFGMTLLSALIWISWSPMRHQFNQFVSSFTIKIFTLQFLNESLYALSALAGQVAIVLGPSVMIVSSMNAFHPIFTLIIGICIAKIGIVDLSKELTRNQFAIKTAAIILLAAGTATIFI